MGKYSSSSVTAGVLLLDEVHPGIKPGSGIGVNDRWYTSIAYSLFDLIDLSLFCIVSYPGFSPPLYIPSTEVFTIHIHASTYMLPNSTIGNLAILYGVYNP